MTQEQTNTIVRTQEVATLIVVYDFDEYVAWRRHNAYQGETVIPIEFDREAFHGYLPSVATKHAFTLPTWHRWWGEFCRSQDAQSERETVADALW